MRLIVTTCLFIALNPLSLRAQTPIPVGDEFEVRSYSNLSRHHSDVGPDGEGGFVVVWYSEVNQGHSVDIYDIEGRRFNPDGETLGEVFRINAYTTSGQFDPSVSSNGGDGFVVVWESYGSYETDSTGMSIQGQVFGGDGSAIGDQFQVNTHTSGDQYLPKVSPASSGGFVVVWRGDNGAQYDSTRKILGQRFSSTGDQVGEQFQADSFDGTHAYGEVALIPQTGFIVVWNTNGSTSGTDRLGRSIQAQRYGLDGSKVGEQFQINSFTSFTQAQPSVSPVGNSGFVVTWRSDGSWGTDSSYWSIQGQVFSADGSAKGNQFQVNSYTTGDQYDPMVRPDGAGGFIVVWTNERRYNPHPPGGGPSRVHGQRYTSAGFALGTQFEVSDLTDSGEKYPAIGLDGGGGFVVSWDRFGGIAARRFLGDNPSEGPFLCVEDAQTLCLQDNRFEVTVEWRDFLDYTGPGKVVPGNSADSGLFWFFNEANWEMLVKVLDGCSLNDRFWVFSAATTDVEYTLKVRDSWTGHTALYFNELGTASPAITDTSAFGSCQVDSL